MPNTEFHCIEHPDTKVPCAACDEDAEREYKRLCEETLMEPGQFKVLVHHGFFGSFILDVLDAHPDLGNVHTEMIDAVGGMAEDCDITVKDFSGFTTAVLKFVSCRYREGGWAGDAELHEVSQSSIEESTSNLNPSRDSLKRCAECGRVHADEEE